MQRQLKEGATEEEIRAGWQDEVAGVYEGERKVFDLRLRRRWLAGGNHLI